VAVALDSASDRIAVQAALPKRTLNAWTQRAELGVSRHRFVGDEACLACLYVPTAKTRNEDELVSDALGLPSALKEVRELLYRNAPASRDLLARVATALNVPLDPLLVFEGKPLREFYSKGICGGIVLSLRGSEGARVDRGTETPLAFQSALAGVLLAAEMVLEACGLRPPGFPTRTSINVLKPLAPQISFFERKASARRCLCQDDWMNGSAQKVVMTPGQNKKAYLAGTLPSPRLPSCLAAASWSSRARTAARSLAAWPRTPSSTPVAVPASSRSAGTPSGIPSPPTSPRPERPSPPSRRSLATRAS
jgi:hypothetical protein